MKGIEMKEILKLLKIMRRFKLNNENKNGLMR